MDRWHEETPTPRRGTGRQGPVRRSGGRGLAKVATKHGHTISYGTDDSILAGTYTRKPSVDAPRPGLPRRPARAGRPRDRRHARTQHRAGGAAAQGVDELGPENGRC
ncbi:hypothetical protein QJS66_02285 [Kocuria rhizophila]|nr:hypothetical protein QJS66_02285 [Kocuria rhizophila]